MGRIGCTSFSTHYGHTRQHTRHPLKCLLSGSSTGKLATFWLSSSIEPTGLSKSSTYLWIKHGKSNFSSSRSCKFYGTVRTRTRRSTRRRRRPFTTDISKDNPFRSTTRCSSTILVLSSFLGNYALDGMVHTWF